MISPLGVGWCRLKTVIIPISASTTLIVNDVTTLSRCKVLVSVLHTCTWRQHDGANTPPLLVYLGIVFHREVLKLAGRHGALLHLEDVLGLGRREGRRHVGRRVHVLLLSVHLRNNLGKRSGRVQVGRARNSGGAVRREAVSLNTPLGAVLVWRCKQQLGQVALGDDIKLWVLAAEVTAKVWVRRNVRGWSAVAYP